MVMSQVNNTVTKVTVIFTLHVSGFTEKIYNCFKKDQALQQDF